MSEPARNLDVRVGSSTDALTPVSRATRSFAATRGQWLSLAVIAVAAIVADQLTKWIVASNLELGDGVHILGPFWIRHVQNSGIAFGFFPSATAAVIVLTGAAIAWMLVYFARSGGRHPVLPIALGLVIGGSVSNLADRVRLGHVTDFLDFRYWPAFNLADSFIVIGVGIILVALVHADRGVTVIDVPPEAAGMRLDRWLAGLPEVGSRGAAERLLEAGTVRVDGSPRGKSHKLAGGETVEFEVAEAPAKPDVAPLDLTIPYEDDHLLVVDKPAGVVVHPGPGHAGGTLAQAVALVGAEGGEEDERAGIVHRLDRDTSGLMVVARSPEAYEELQRLVRHRELVREYLALVVGKPRSRSGTIDAPIGRDRRDRVRHSLDTDTPRAAVTHFEIEELLDGYALLRVRLETGRTHQIRVHLEAIELPVAGDRTYGRAGVLGLERQFLHATRLAFTHPVTGDEIDVSSPLPPDLAAALDRAR